MKKLEYPPDFVDKGLPYQGRFSPSQYGSAKRCMKGYYYRYICGMKSKPGFALIGGSAIHKGAEATHQNTINTGKPLGLEEATQAVSDSFEKRKVEIEDWGDTKPGTYKDRTIHNFGIYHRTAVPLINPVKVESSFAVKFGTVPVIGFIDLIDQIAVDNTRPLEKGEKPLMVEVVSDLKCTGKKWSDQQVRHAPQLTFYAHAESTPNVRVDMLLTLKSGARYVPQRSIRTPHDTAMLIEDLEMTVDLIKRGFFPRTDPTSWACTPKWCGFYENCRGPK